MEIEEQGNTVINTKDELSTFNDFIEDLYVPRFEDGFDRSANKSDYSLYLESCDQKFERLYNMIKNRCSSIYIDKLKQQYLTSVIILHGEHSSTEIWTTVISCKLSKAILDEILAHLKYSNLKNALISNSGIIFGNVLKILRPKLLKNTWKSYRAAIVCYSYLLPFVESPHLAEYLNSVLPTALILTDDFILENRLLGLKCLEHIINNVGKSHLSWFSQDKVILQALEYQFLYKEEVLIKPLLLVFIALLKKKYPQHGYTVLVTDEFDSIIDKILHHMILEQRIKSRNAYFEMLPLIIKTRGLGILLHSIAILKVIDESVLESTSSLEVIEILKCFIVVCWPRLNEHFEHIFLTVCKIYLGLKYKTYPDVCKKKIMEIALILQNIFPENFRRKKTFISGQKSLSELEEIFK